MGEKQGSNLKPPCLVHPEHVRRRPADGSHTDDPEGSEGEVLRSIVAPGVEERNELTTIRVDTAQVRPLEGVATGTRQSKVLGAVASTVLLRDDVLDVVGELDVLLAEEAVFAAVPGSQADKRPGVRIHR